MGQSFDFQTPLMWLDKADTWALAQTLGAAPLVDILLEDSHTCYHGVRDVKHAWGYGCGTCPACALRRAGFERWVSQLND
jgi:7-cyano-7-deazaguanine synthase